MKVRTKGTVLSAASKPYDFDGRSGVSHKIRVMVEGEIFNCSSTEQDVKDAQLVVGKTGEVELIFTSPRENLKVEVELIEFEE